MAVLNGTALNLLQLRELMFTSVGGVVASPFDEQPYLLLRLDASTDTQEGSAAELADLAAWLETQPCPVIGLMEAGEGSGSLLHEACDLVLDHEASLDTIIANIRHAPLAAMTLVQVLRVTEKLSPTRALRVESLAYSTLQAGPEFGAWSRANPPVAFSVSADSGSAVLIERHAERVDVTLNRPASRNAMSIEMRDGMVEALQLIVADASIERARFSGAGACFSIGGDLREFGTAADPASAHAVRSMRLPAAVLIHCAARTEFHLHSACIGAGIELPAFAGWVSAAPNAFFQLPEIHFGLIPGAGGCVSLPRRIGRQRTAYLALSARRIDAATALDWGLIDKILD